jgi:hypothetical protein
MQNKRGRRFYGQLERAGVWRCRSHQRACRWRSTKASATRPALTADSWQHCPDLYTQMLKEHSDNE